MLRTDGRTDARTDNVKTVYPPHTKFAWGIMIVLTGVNFADKENMYKQTKNSLIKFMGGFNGGRS